MEYCWKKILRGREALPKEEGDAVRVYEGMHEENFLSSWLREYGREKEEGMVEMSNENREERGSTKEKRGGERRKLNGNF